LPKITTMRFNFLKLLDRILLHLFRRRYVIASFLMTQRLRHQMFYVLSKMSPHDGSRQKLQNCLHC